jgi:DNA repair exonuclease SbcCD ATPase subunit
MSDSENTTPQGSVYLIVNDLIPDRVKIGTTGTFVVIYQALVHEPFRVEQEVHRRFAHLNRGLEWFEVCPNLAKGEILQVAGELLYENTAPRWHPSQPAPSQRTRELLAEAKKAAEEARRADEEARARRAEEEEAARQAAEALAIEEERQRRQREAEDKKQREEEEAQRAVDAERRRQEQEERKRQSRIFVARCLKVVVGAIAVFAWYRLVDYATKKERAWHARAADACIAEVARLKQHLEATQMTITSDQASIARLEKTLASVVAKLRSFPDDVKGYKSQEQYARDKLAEFEKYLLTRPLSEREASKRRHAGYLARHRTDLEQATKKLENANADSQRLSSQKAQIARQIADLHGRISALSDEATATKRLLTDAEAKAARLAWARSAKK